MTARHRKGGPVSKLSIPRWLMEDWKEFLNRNDYTPQWSHIALWHFMNMNKISHHEARQAFNRWNNCEAEPKADQTNPAPAPIGRIAFGKALILQSEDAPEPAAS